MNRRLFLKSMAAASTTALVGLPHAEAALPPAKITRVRIYQPPNLNQLFNQSNMLCTVETDAGLTGIGEGGSKDTLEQCAGSLIGKNPFQIETLWQRMYMEWFYPPGREKIHALGALDMALWDIKGKAFKAPVHQLLNGSEREYMECYPTSGVGGGGGLGGTGRGAAAGAGGASGAAAGAPPNTGRVAAMSLKERAAATIAAGYRAFRIDGSIGLGGNVFDVHQRVREVAKACKEVREGVGDKGDWSIDFHQKFDFPDARRTVPGGHSETAEDDDLPLGRRRGVGPALEFQPTDREPRHRLHPRYAAQRRGYHGDDEGSGALRDARYRNCSALHGPRVYRGAGKLPGDVPGPGVVRVQL